MALYRFAQCELDTSRRELRRGGDAVRLSPRSFKALEMLLQRYPSAVSRDELYGALWPDTFVNLTNLNNVIAEIRSAIADRSKKIVITRQRFGYGIGVPVVTDRQGRAPRSRFSVAIAGETFILHEGENLVGRSPEAVVVLDLPSISRHHAVIRVSTDSSEVEDLKSKNGTFVRGERVGRVRELLDGDAIQFGSICGIFRGVAVGATTATDPTVQR